jgi:hypothetical protein
VPEAHQAAEHFGVLLLVSKHTSTQRVIVANVSISALNVTDPDGKRDPIQRPGLSEGTAHDHA